MNGIAMRYAFFYNNRQTDKIKENEEIRQKATRVFMDAKDNENRMLKLPKA